MSGGACVLDGAVQTVGVYTTGAVVKIGVSNSSGSVVQDTGAPNSLMWSINRR